MTHPGDESGLIWRFTYDDNAGTVTATPPGGAAGIIRAASGDGQKVAYAYDAVEIAGRWTTERSGDYSRP